MEGKIQPIVREKLQQLCPRVSHVLKLYLNQYGVTLKSLAIATFDK